MIDAPLCPHCNQTMLLNSKLPNGQCTYYCGCIPGQITWHTIHPDKEIPRVKRTGQRPE